MDNILNKFRDEIKDLPSAKRLVNKFLEKALQESEIEETNDSGITFNEFWNEVMNAIYPTNIETIFKYSESEIEKLFLVSFMLYLIKNNIFDFIITPPIKDTQQELKEFREHIRKRRLDIEAYLKDPGKTLHDYVDEINQLALEGKIPKDHAERISTEVFFEQHFIWDSFHITMQPAFPNILVDGKSIRCDMLIWKPDDERIKIIVECDGYEFHKDKPAFIRDRKRDRALKFQGFDVIRFSGSEIFTDFPKVSAELSDYVDFVNNNLCAKNTMQLNK